MLAEVENGSARHSLFSSFRENAIERIFIAELLRGLWRRGYSDVEILRAEVDAAGYDVVVEAAGVMRHIQLKASFAGARTNRQVVNKKLETKPSGCVVWIIFDGETLNLSNFLWLGGRPGEKLPSMTELKLAKHPKGNAQGVKSERANSYSTPRARFEKIETLDLLIDRLFFDVAP